jgi:hypothetical protein
MPQSPTSRYDDLEAHGFSEPLLAQSGVLPRTTITRQPERVTATAVQRRATVAMPQRRVAAVTAHGAAAQRWTEAAVVMTQRCQCSRLLISSSRRSTQLWRIARVTPTSTCQQRLTLQRRQRSSHTAGGLGTMPFSCHDNGLDYFVRHSFEKQLAPGRVWIDQRIAAGRSAVGSITRSQRIGVVDGSNVTRADKTAAMKPARVRVRSIQRASSVSTLLMPAILRLGHSVLEFP